MAIQEVEIFAGVGPFPVMGFLVPDVVSEALVIKPGDRERTVPMLPSEILSVRKGLMNPTSGVCLDCADQLGNGYGAWRLEVQVYVISHAAGAEQPSSLPLDNLTNTSEQSSPPLRVEPGPTVLGGPHEMQS
jgi:hypothetical protein